VVVSAIGVGIVLGLNWRRLGKPEWLIPTIALSILIPGIALAASLGWVFFMIPRPGMPIEIIVSIPFLALSTNFGYAWALARLQNVGYKAFKAHGPEGLQGFDYDVQGAALFGAGVTLAIWVITLFVVPALQS
jgi:hypothetical protein